MLVSTCRDTVYRDGIWLFCITISRFHNTNLINHTIKHLLTCNRIHVLPCSHEFVGSNGFTGWLNFQQIQLILKSYEGRNKPLESYRVLEMEYQRSGYVRDLSEQV